MTSFPYLTKSKFLQGLNCQKCLWLSVNNPEKAKPIDTSTARRFENGKKIGEFAQQLFPGGILITDDHTQLEQAIVTTRKQVSLNTSTIFEATEQYNRIRCRADILQKVKKSTWNIYEVKMSTKYKPLEHLPDVAIQYYCFQKAGYSIENTYLVLVNSSYVRQEEIDLTQFLQIHDITDEVKAYIKNIEPQIENLIAVLDSEKCPSIKIGEYCSKPYECSFFDHCHQGLDFTIHEIHGRGNPKIKERLSTQGIFYLKDIPDTEPLNQRITNMVRSVKIRKSVINKNNIRSYFNELVYPLYYFDFETIFIPIPLFENTRPYQQIPFQYSLHIQDKKSSSSKHVDFLMTDNDDPRERLIVSMLSHLGKKGSIIAYNATFEKRIITQLAEAFPHFRDELNALIPRFWDLMKPFENGDYVHYDFHGRWSIKYVLPVLIPSLSYKDLEVQDGGMASALADKWYSSELEESKWYEVRENLLKYCELDTLAMVKIVEKLSQY